MRRRPRRNRTLTREEWDQLLTKVINRDLAILTRWLKVEGYHPIKQGPGTLLVGARLMPVCPAVVVDPSVLGTCWGPWKLDHVKKDPRVGVKAEDEAGRLMALCAAHDERGMKAGYQWNTAHRAEQRAYLLATGD